MKRFLPCLLCLAAACVGVPALPNTRASVAALAGNDAITYTSLASLAADMGLSVETDPVTRLCTLEDGLNRLRLAPGTSLILVNHALVGLAGPVRRGSEGVELPVGSQERIRPFLVDPHTEVFPALAAASAGNLALEVASRTSPDPASSRAGARAFGDLSSAPGKVPTEWVVPAGRTWKYIVIHHSATETGSAAQFDDYHRNVRHWQYGLGYHFVIGNGHGAPDGQVVPSQRWLKQLHGAHAGVKAYNEHGIGICLVGNFEGSRPTDKQMASLRQLVRFLMSRYRIPASGIRLHRDVRQGTACPGHQFSLDNFRQDL